MERDLFRRIQIRFLRNLPGFWKNYRILIVVFIFALLCDALSTIYFMYIDGPEAEMNPLIRMSGRVYGPIFGPILSFLIKIIFGLLLAIYLRRYALLIFVSVIVISIYACWYNIWSVDVRLYLHTENYERLVKVMRLLAF